MIGVAIVVNGAGNSHSHHLQAAALGVTELVGDPDVAKAVDGKAAAGVAGLEGLGLGRIIAGKARDMAAKDVGDPDIVFLVDGKGERQKNLAGFFSGSRSGFVHRTSPLVGSPFGI